MSLQKIQAKETINLQNGMFCHVTDEFFVIKDQSSLYESDFKPTLDNVKNIKPLRMALNILFSLIVLAFSFYTHFYPLILLLFVSVWDLRQLKRYQLPINQSSCIPIQSIKELRLVKGGMGLNFMDVIIEHNGVLSLCPLKLYDSASTFQQTKTIAEKLGKLTTVHQNEQVVMDGVCFPLNEVDEYILENNKLHYCHKKTFEIHKKDSYLYVRSLSLIFTFFILYAFGAKVYLMLNQYFNYVDFTILLALLLLLKLPYYYLQKALPNVIDVTQIKALKEDKKHWILILKQKNSWNLKVYFRKDKLGKQVEALKNLIP